MFAQCLRCSLLLAAVAAVACAPEAGATIAESTDGSGDGALARTLVETVTLESTDFVETIRLSGETAPVRHAWVAPELAGRIVRLELDEGDTVAAGQTVLRVDTALAAAERAQLDTRVEALGRDIDRAERLIERGLGTVAELEQLQTERRIVLQSIDQLDVNLRHARTAAPIDGVVVEKLAEVGEFASPGVPVARIVDLSTAVVRVGLPEREIAFVEEGMAVSVRIEATGEERSGVLAEIGIEAQPASRTFPLEIHLDNADGALRAGMRASASIPKRDLRGVIVIPRDAVLQGIDGQEVFVESAGVAELRRVEVGPGRGRFSVVSSGLAAGDELVVRGHRLLVQGEDVRTAPLGGCCATQLRASLGQTGGPGTRAPE